MCLGSLHANLKIWGIGGSPELTRNKVISIFLLVSLSFHISSLHAEFSLACWLMFYDYFFLLAFTLKSLVRSWIIFFYLGFCKTGPGPTLCSSDGNMVTKSD